MKKLRLKALSLGAKEILSREQLREVTGGSTVTGCCWQTGWGPCYVGPYKPYWQCIDGSTWCNYPNDMYSIEYALGCHD
jgi:hypothetical protein